MNDDLMKLLWLLKLFGRGARKYAPRHKTAPRKPRPEHDLAQFPVQKGVPEDEFFMDPTDSAHDQVIQQPFTPGRLLPTPVPRLEREISS